MTVDEIATKFTFKADTNKAKKFAKATDKIKDGLQKTDHAWTRMNNKLAAGFQSKWFDQFSRKVTDLRRVQLFTGGIRRGFEFASKAIPGLKGLSNVVTAVTMKYNKFSGTLIKARSAMRSFGILLGKTVHGIIPMVRSELTSFVTIIKAGITKAVVFIKGMNWVKLWGRVKVGLRKAITAIGTGLKKLLIMFKGGFAKLHAYLLRSNNKFLSALGRGITKIQARIAGMKGISSLGRKIKDLTKNVPGLGKLTSAFGSFGVGAVAALAAVAVAVVGVVIAVKALVGKIKKSTEDFIAFEQGMKGVQRVTLASAKDMLRLEDAALKAGEASVFSVKDAADAQKFLAMAGLEVDEVIGALSGTLELAAAAEMDLATAADIATNIMSSNALAVKDLGRVNDILAFSASNSNQNVMQLGSAIQNIGPAGRLASLSVEQMSSWLSILANNGLRGEEAGTMVRNAIMDLVNPTDKMSKALEAGGIAMSDFVDATGKISNLNDLMMALQEMDEVSRATFLGTLDQRTWKALAPIITGNVEKMAAFNVELAKASGTAAAMAGIAFQGLDGAIKEYKSKMETANVSFMKDSGLNVFFEEIVRTGTAFLPELWKSIGLSMKPFVKILIIIMKVIRTVFTIVGGILKVFNNIGRVVMSIMDDALKPLIDAWDQITVGIKKAFSLLSDMDTGPLEGIKRVASAIGKILAFAVTTLLQMLGPFLFLVDLFLNLFLIILPRIVSGFFDKIETWWQESFLSRAGEYVGNLFVGGEGGEDQSGRAFSKVPKSEGSDVVTGGYRTTTIGKVETNITVQGGLTNEDTAAAVAAAANEAMSRQLRSLKQEVQ